MPQTADVNTKPAPDPTLGHLEFQNTVDGVLVKALGKDLTPTLRLKLRESGLDLDKKLLPGYPAKKFHEWLSLAASEVYAGFSPEEAVRRLGVRSTSGLEETLMGKALKGTISIIGMRRALQRTQRIFRSHNNYMEVVSRELAPTATELTFNFVHGLPTYYQGVLEGACHLTGAKKPQVKMMPEPPPGARFLITWEE